MRTVQSTLYNTRHGTIITNTLLKFETNFETKYTSIYVARYICIEWLVKVIERLSQKMFKWNFANKTNCGKFKKSLPMKFQNVFYNNAHNTIVRVSVRFKYRREPSR